MAGARKDPRSRGSGDSGDTPSGERAGNDGAGTVASGTVWQTHEVLAAMNDTDFASAVQYLERYFELARQIGDRQIIDKARTYLGIARGNSVLPSFMNVVTTDLDALLRWKNRRTPFTDMAMVSH